ncbi:FHA domain-containing protein [Cyanobacterium sp. IPPAS B-1200]|uniref:FHA domain-containing protein n=1 Tax=Cyanobacterium sp. IPPAS B-1200 TaxID=1562720 RepID=UPI003D528F95
MEIQLITQNAVTEEQEEETFSLPIVFGRDGSQLPTTIDNQESSSIVLLDSQNLISRFHAIIKESENQVILEDKSSNGTFINNQRVYQESTTVHNGDVITIGNYSITIAWGMPPTVITSSPSTILSSPPEIYSPTNKDYRASTIIFDPETDLVQPQGNITPTPTPVISSNSFPPADIFAEEKISVSALQKTNLPIKETTYLSIGGGLGSFVYTDHLRIAGVPTENIAVVGLNPIPYGRYERLLRNCQIFRYKRIRSGSDSCPDNLWGWPGYALREAWKELFLGHINEAFTCLWQVFAEPVFADTYTPIADNVFNSIDRETKRIGWEKMFYQGSVRAIRKTEDGRYCIAYSASKPGQTDHRFVIADFLHICTGYPALKLLPDLQRYRDATGDLKSVVQGYESHDHVYEKLERKGGTVIIRGSGIVASQIMDRLYLVHKTGSKLKIIHMNREPRKGFQFEQAQREVENDWEFQPYNWPKATWGGDMRKKLEEASPPLRRELLQSWGGTTTSSRKPWRRIVQQGLQEGWYEIRYGLVKEVQSDSNGGVISTLLTNKGEDIVHADFIIDCTGLVSDPRHNPLLDDLITHYEIPLNIQGRLHVENDFEIKKMRNGNGKVYANGIITLGGPYAAVDTFLGLQYSAHRIIESLALLNAPDVNYISGIYSLAQWFRWANNQKP